MKGALALIGAIVALGSVGVAGAEVNAVTPSTNEINQANGWAYVDVDVTAGPRTATLTFHSTRSFYSCFEYRTDGDTSQVLSGENGGQNYNTAVTDGLYPYVCVNNSTDDVTVSAKAYVEVRMVFGSETDERFDWTRFNVQSCAPTGFMRDGINLTAAQIGGDVTGELDATGCNIGVYNPDSVSDADIHGANYFGVVVNGKDDVDVTDSTVHDIGESPLNGAQHGNAIAYIEGASGTVSGNDVYRYQKNGITISGDDTSASVLGNTVTGAGQVDWIAQNGIQVSFSATALVRGNTVTGNWYTPASYVACGLLFYQANGVKQQANTLSDNEVDLCNAGRGGGNTSAG